MTKFSDNLPSVTDAPACFAPAKPLRGTISVPGDKSISHRALILSALAVGRSTVSGLLEGEDVLATAAALRAMGARIEKQDAVWTIDGVGVGGLLSPERALDLGNSGTSARLLMGLIATHPITATLTGDASLSRRPMGRVIDPLSAMGAAFTAQRTVEGKDCLPLTMRGLTPAIPLDYRLPVASAQVKSALLLAGLNTPGITRIVEPVPTRDHSETMLKGYGATLAIHQNQNGERVIELTGEAELSPQEITVPGDPSSAAFPVVAALLTPGSDIIVENVGINPTRAGLFAVLREMGGDISFINEREVGGEPVADLHVTHSALQGIDISPELAPSMIDEFPILFIAAAMAKGTTHTSGLDELRVKESDRLACMAAGLTAIGAAVDEREDGLVITGSDGAPLPGNRNGDPVQTNLDHRIAMSFAIAGLVSADAVLVDDLSPIATSFPGFLAMLDQLQQAAE